MLLLVGSVFASMRDLKAPVQDTRLCDPSLPTLSVGDRTLTDGDFLKFKRANKLFVMGIADSSCADCCQSEPLLKRVSGDFKDKVHIFATKKVAEIVIPVVRVDVAEKSSFLEQQNVRTTDLPAVFVYYDGAYYSFPREHFGEPKRLIHLMNRLLHPLVNLRSQEAIETFLNVNAEHEEKTKFMMPTGVELRPELMLDRLYKDLKYKTRAIICIYNRGDYDEEIESLKEVARRSAHMLNLRIGIVSDAKLVKKLKKETHWFGDASLNTLIVKRYDGELFNLDLLQVSMQENAYAWIWKKSIKEVEAMNEQYFDQVNMIGQGVMMVWVDMISKNPKVKQDSQTLVNTVLPNVAKAVYKAMIVTYVDVNKYAQLKRQFGISHDKVPAISISDSNRQILVYPKDEPLYSEEIIAFATRVVKGEIKPERSQVHDILNTELIKKVEKHIGELVTPETFASELKQEGFDAALLIFSSSIEDKLQEEFVKEFIECKKRFKKMRHRGIRFFAVDINQQPNINFGTSTQAVPLILFYPAFQKSITVHRYVGDVDSISMSKFLHKKADIKFEMKETYFKPAKSPFGDQVTMEMDESGNIRPDSGKMAELQ